MADYRDVRLEDAHFQRALANFQARLHDLRPFWPLVVPIFIGWMKQQFDSEGDFAGDHWAPLSEDYRLYKEAKYPGKGILQAEGDLRKAASHPKRLVTRSTLVLEVDDPKVGFHQDGTAKMPARPLLFGDPLPAIARAELEGAAEVYVAEAARLSGLKP